MTKTIDLTPTWEESVPMLLHLMEAGTTREAAQCAKDEILRMAKMADEYIKSIKTTNSKLIIATNGDKPVDTKFIFTYRKKGGIFQRQFQSSQLTLDEAFELAKEHCKNVEGIFLGIQQEKTKKSND